MSDVVNKREIEDCLHYLQSSEKLTNDGSDEIEFKVLRQLISKALINGLRNPTIYHPDPTSDDEGFPFGITYAILKEAGGDTKWLKSLVDKVKQSSQLVLEGMIADLEFHLERMAQAINAPHTEFPSEIPSFLGCSVNSCTNSKFWVRPLPPNCTKEILECKICMGEIDPPKNICDPHDLWNLPGNPIHNAWLIRRSEHIVDMHPQVALFSISGVADGTDLDMQVIEESGQIELVEEVTASKGAFCSSVVVQSLAWNNLQILHDIEKKELKKEKKRRAKEEKKQHLKNKQPRTPRRGDGYSRPKKVYRTPDVINKQIESLDAVEQEPKLKTITSTSYERPTSIIRNLKSLHKKCMICKVKHFRQANGERYCEVAHIIPNSVSQNNNSNNLIVVCPTCHKKFDLGKISLRIELYDKLRANFPGKDFTIPLWYEGKIE